ncbi:MAG: CCxxC motif-containing NuoF prefix domain-containing protein [Dethiobacteria bacterium]|nr:CCxxC motif-containing NuoF prefix domain-containing protein [Bacillota bacterium]
MERFIDHCCEKCTHSKESACKDFIACCVEGPICHENPECKAKRKTIMARVALNDKFVIC